MMMVETASARFVERARPLIFPKHDPTPLLDTANLRGMDRVVKQSLQMQKNFHDPALAMLKN